MANRKKSKSKIINKSYNQNIDIETFRLRKMK